MYYTVIFSSGRKDFRFFPDADSFIDYVQDLEHSGYRLTFNEATITADQSFDSADLMRSAEMKRLGKGNTMSYREAKD